MPTTSDPAPRREVGRTSQDVAWDPAGPERRRWDSPLVLAMAGTIAIHLIVMVAADAVVVYNPPRPPKPAPRIELVEIEVPPVIKPPPPPVVRPEPEPEPPPDPDPPPVRPREITRAPVQPETRAPVQPLQTEPVTDPTSSGGDQVVTLDEAPPSATGVAVAVGRRTTGRVGRGGTGGGTGTGSGSGAGSAAPPPPMSVATIKKRALPRGDYAYFDAGKDYPPEARQLGIEGPIRVRLVVDDKGKVRSTVLLNRLGHGLDELALRRAAQIQFDPAVDTDDRPVTSVVVWTFNMTLPR